MTLIILTEGIKSNTSTHQDAGRVVEPVGGPEDNERGCLHPLPGTGPEIKMQTPQKEETFAKLSAHCDRDNIRNGDGHVDCDDSSEDTDDENERNHRDTCLACNGESFESKVLELAGDDLGVAASLTPLLHTRICLGSSSAADFVCMMLCSACPYPATCPTAHFPMSGLV